jgi:hypothetical protein
MYGKICVVSDETTYLDRVRPRSPLIPEIRLVHFEQSLSEARITKMMRRATTELDPMD